MLCTFEATVCLSHQPYYHNLFFSAIKYHIHSKNDDDPLNVDTAAADFQNIVLKAATLSLKFKSTKFKKYTHLKKKWYGQDLCNTKKELYIKTRHMSANPFNINIRNNYFKNLNRQVYHLIY
jgi:hypothetical protein